MKAALALILAATVLSDVSPADACSISAAPDAHVFGRPDNTTRGHRPWIRLWMVKPTEVVTLNAVDGTCDLAKLCPNGKPVAFERSEHFLRPAADLPSGTHLQVVLGKKLLESFTVVTTDAVKDLPAWDGVTAPTVAMAKEGLCAPAGPVITFRVKATKADLGDAVLLVWLRKPDIKRPQVGLSGIYTLRSDDDVELRNGFGAKWMTKQPTKFWYALADGDGHIGPVTEHKF